MLELADSGRNVMNAQTITFYDKEMASNVKAAFPNAGKKKTSNGSVGFLID